TATLVTVSYQGFHQHRSCYCRRFPHLLLTANHLRSTVMLSFGDAMKMIIAGRFV
ncbi:hypothetical protein BC827DRAFT_1252234, partial [Russula dissimulans]